MSVTIRGEVELVCEATGEPQPEVVWYRGSTPLHADSNMAVYNGDTEGRFNDGTRLVIKTVRMEDLGDYTCLARNGGLSTAERVFSLELEGPRQMENVTVETIEVNFGGEATLKCPLPSGVFTMC